MTRDDAPRETRGTLILVVGPSGVGKDSLIAYCRAHLDAGAVSFPRRFITRPAGADAEAHHPMAEEAFLASAADGAFALHWRAHGLAYGIPSSIEADLTAGRTVVVNVSRAVVEEARRRFPPVVVVSVTAAAETLAERIRQRGREAGETADRRLARAGDFPVEGDDVVHLDNSGPLERAGKRLLTLIRGAGSRSPDLPLPV
jgi:ribose 1,5-bisphosphokinase